MLQDPKARTVREEIRLDSGIVIGPKHPCFIVAEIGNNHQGKLALAKEMVHAAADMGADAVKFQKRDTDALLTKEGLKAPYTGANSFGPTYGQHRKALELSIDEMADLKELSERLGLVFFASSWDVPSIRQMADLGMELIKVSSADLVSTPLLREIGSLHIPIIASTGMSNWEEIDNAVAELKNYHDQIMLLHCNSSYPCPEEEIHLPVMDELRERYGFPVGYSGHEPGLGPSLAAVARGACIVERHFTLSKNLPGTDHKASLEPDDFKMLVQLTREIEKSLKGTTKKVFPTERDAAAKLRKSVVTACGLSAGTVIIEEHLTVKSPGTGISPMRWDEVVGKTLTRNVPEDEFLSWDMLKE